jgi:hypothetical protein
MDEMCECTVLSPYYVMDESKICGLCTKPRRRAMDDAKREELEKSVLGGREPGPVPLLCKDCGRVFGKDDLIWGDEIIDPAPGDPATAGKCPVCDGLCYPSEGESLTARAREVASKLQLLASRLEQGKIMTAADLQSLAKRLV